MKSSVLLWCLNVLALANARPAAVSDSQLFNNKDNFQQNTDITGETRDTTQAADNANLKLSQGAVNIPNDITFCQIAANQQFQLQDGLQVKNGSCSTTVMGLIPSQDKMVSSVIIAPVNGATIPVGQQFTVKMKIQNMDTGFFDQSDTLYYKTPQTLNKNGIIQGHDHITIQPLNVDANGVPTAPPDASKFAFFKGLNAIDDNGVLNVTVPGLNNSGVFRICSMAASRAHTPVLSPVAKRGSQDDCIRVNVGNAQNAAANNNAGAGAGAAANNNAGAGAGAAANNNAGTGAGANNAGAGTGAAANNNAGAGSNAGANNNGDGGVKIQSVDDNAGSNANSGSKANDANQGSGNNDNQISVDCNQANDNTATAAADTQATTAAADTQATTAATDTQATTAATDAQAMSMTMMNSQAAAMTMMNSQAATMTMNGQAMTTTMNAQATNGANSSKNNKKPAY